MSVPANTIIKVIGIGGAGGNAINRLMLAKISRIELIAANTDAQDLKKIRADKKIQLGKMATQGRGAGMNPELGRKSAIESTEEVAKVLAGADMVVLAAGLGGGTGGGAAPLIAEIAKAQGALTLAVVATPFSFEGAWRMRLAKKALEELGSKIDTLLVIPNDKVLGVSQPDTTVLEAFFAADEVLRQAVQGIADIIALPGIINVDFADVKAIMANSGRAVLGIGKAKGEKRIEQALENALRSPLLTLSIEGAKGVLFHLSGLEDLAVSEVEEVARRIRQKVSPDAKIIFGAAKDKTLQPGEVKLLVLACGFSS